MTALEFSDYFDLFYNNITSNQAPGLDGYEKSVFLTTAQELILRAFFNPKENKIFDGFDSSALRLIDFSAVTKVFNGTNLVYRYIDTGEKDSHNQTLYTRELVQGSSTGTYILAYDDNGDPIKDKYICIDSNTVNVSLQNPLFDKKYNSKSIILPDDILAIINEEAIVSRDSKLKVLTGIPLSYLEYLRVSRKPYKSPLKSECWRLICNNGTNKADIVIGPSDILQNYTIRYIRKPRPIILELLSGVSIEKQLKKTDCELDPSLHNIILQRAVELAKAAYMDMNQQGILIALAYAMGLSATNLGLISSR